MDEQVKYTLNGRIWAEVNDGKVLGKGRVELLERIHASGSIRQAAIQMKMSYKQAWDMVNHINDNFPKPIVISTRGGKGGGKATVTEAGLVLIDQFHALQIKLKEFLEANSGLFVI